MEILNEVLYRPLFNALIFLYNTIAFQDLGVAIIILTVVIRLILWPSQSKALRSQIALQRLQPKLDELKNKYKDKQKQTQALLEFYRENKVSPFSSCLPTLIQLPIIIALYQVFRHSLNQESLSALYPFVSRPETIHAISLGFLDLSRPDHLILPYLAGALQFVQSWMIMGRTPKPSAGGDNISAAISKQMLYIFPFFTVFIAFSLPAALPLYWVVTTLLAIIQQYYIMKEDPKVKKMVKDIGVKVKVKRGSKK